MQTGARSLPPASVRATPHWHATWLTAASVDTSFGTGGEVTTDFGGNDNAFGVVVQPDGKILAAGTEDGKLPWRDISPTATLTPLLATAAESAASVVLETLTRFCALSPTARSSPAALMEN